MRVGFLGPLELAVDGRVVGVGGTRLRALLLRLALEAGRTVPASVLVDAVWPGGGPVDPANALQTLVARLRRVLPPECLVSVGGGYRLDVPVDAVDAYRFRRLADEGRNALGDGAPDIAERLLGEALGLWRGAPPPELPEAERHGLEEARLGACEDRAAAALAAGHADGLVVELERLIAGHPFRERLRALQVRTLRALGRRAEALAAYERARAFLAEELGADPGPELRDAHLAALTDAGPPAGTPRTAAAGLVGRADDLAELRRSLAGGRLVSLTGPGGVGKTRLATALLAGRTGPAWWVDLVPVPSGADGIGAVARAVAETVGVDRAGPLDEPPDPWARLTEVLRSENALLVLDNCEHLADGTAALVARLLERCAGLRILVTSREPLRVPGEVAYPVRPLVPAAAARLFAERAAAARPGFAVTEGNAALVAEICARLDGLPLAIELAAARLGALPLDELAAGLDDRFALLDGAARTADRRHQGLRGVIDWSWRPLDPGERRCARRLSVFPGGFATDGAEAVAGADLRTLAGLADRSLLWFDGDRYRMLETIRAYAHEELVRAGERDAARAAHAAYVLDLAERAEPRLRGPDQVPWLARLRAERGDLRAALAYAAETGDAALARRLCSALTVFWLLTGDHHAMATWTRAALDIDGPAPPEATAICATVRLLAGAPRSGTGQSADVRRLARQCPPGHPVAALVEPVLAILGDGAEAAFEPALGHQDGWTRAVARLLRAAYRGGRGDRADIAGMRRDLTGAIAGFRTVADRGGLAWALTALADVQTTSGENRAAIAGLEEAVRLLRELDPADSVALQRLWIAEARARDGDTARARTEMTDLLAPGTTLPCRELCTAWITLGDIARRDGDPGAAARHLDQARRVLDTAPDPGPDHRLQLECVHAELLLDQGDLERARRHLAAAFDLAVAVSDRAFAAIAAARLARLRRLRGQAAGAAEILGAAHSVIGGPEPLDSELTAITAELRADLGEPAYTEAYTRGRHRSPDDALALIAAQLA